MLFAERLIVREMIDQNHGHAVAPERVSEFVTFLSRHSEVLLRNRRGQWQRPVKPSIIAACVILSLATLGACSKPVNCSAGDYRGGCLAGPEDAAATQPVAAAPVAAQPVPASPVVINPAVAPAGVSRGEPREFAVVDDKQCRSYGLTFGSHDYADCRIRLSAQHRGMDPGSR
jgi:hypothetical protein